MHTLVSVSGDCNSAVLNQCGWYSNHTKDNMILGTFQLLISSGSGIIGTLPRCVFSVVFGPGAVDRGYLYVVLAAGLRVLPSEIRRCDLESARLPVGIVGKLLDPTPSSDVGEEVAGESTPYSFATLLEGVEEQCGVWDGL